MFKPRRLPEPRHTSRGPFSLKTAPSSDGRSIHHITDATARIIGAVHVAEGFGPLEPLANATLMMASHELREALDRAEALLVQVQESPQLARDIVRRPYFGLVLTQMRDALKRAQPEERS